MCNSDFYGLSSSPRGHVTAPGQEHIFWNIDGPLECTQRFIPAVNQSISLQVNHTYLLLLSGSLICMLLDNLYSATLTNLLQPDQSSASSSAAPNFLSYISLLHCNISNIVLSYSGSFVFRTSFYNAFLVCVNSSKVFCAIVR